MATGNPDLAPVPPWQPAIFPPFVQPIRIALRLFMAFLAAFAYDPRIEGKPPTIPSEISNAGFEKITSFHSGYTDGWAYIVEGKEIIVLAFRGTVSQKNWHTNFNAALIQPPNTDANLRVHEGFYRAFSNLSDGTKGIETKITEVKQETQGQIPIYITGHSLGGRRHQPNAPTTGSTRLRILHQAAIRWPFIGGALRNHHLRGIRGAVGAQIGPISLSARLC